VIETRPLAVEEAAIIRRGVGRVPCAGEHVPDLVNNDLRGVVNGAGDLTGDHARHHVHDQSTRRLRYLQLWAVNWCDRLYVRCLIHAYSLGAREAVCQRTRQQSASYIVTMHRTVSRARLPRACPAVAEPSQWFAIVFPSSDGRAATGLVVLSASVP
jgi:hypothetical protein